MRLLGSWSRTIIAGGEERPLRSRSSSGLFLQAGTKQQNPYVRQVSVALGIVEAIAHDKLVGYRKTDVVRAHCGEPPLRLVQQDRHAQVFRLALLKQPQQIIQGHSSV